jgi:hypothetical protein
MRSSNGDLTHRQDWVQDGTLLDIFGNVVGIFHCKSKNGVSTNVLSKSNHTRGGEITEINAQVNPRIRLWFYLWKTRLYAKVHLKRFQNKLLSIKEHMVLVHTGSKFKTATGLPVRRSTRHSCRTLPKQPTPVQPFPERNSSYVTTP